MSGADAVRDIIEGASVVRFPRGRDGGNGGRDINLDLAEKEFNDLGNGDRFRARHGADLLYVRDVGEHQWTGTHWSPEGAAERWLCAAHETARSVVEEADALKKRGGVGDDGRAKALLDWAVESGDKRRTAAMIAQAAPYLTVGPRELDADPMILNLANGTLRIEGACDALRDHCRDDLLAKVMPVAYDPAAICPTFDGFLAEVQPDPEIRLFLQVFGGYCLTGDTREQKLLFNYGEGSNGKSVFVDLLGKIMGPYAVTLPFSSLLRDDRKRGSEATPDLARLPGARMVRASEPEKGAAFAEATIKSITGGEEFPVRRLRHDFFDMVPMFKLILSGNHRPRIRGGDHGIWRRFLLVPWGVIIPDERQDKTLPAKLWEERSGVLNWLLDGARIWLERGLVVPAAVRAATDEYRRDSDPLGRFIEDCVQREEGPNVPASRLYAAFVAWCRANAEKPWSQTAFGKGLPERGFRRIKTAYGNEYADIVLHDVPSEGDAPPAPGPDDF